MEGSAHTSRDIDTQFGDRVWRQHQPLAKERDGRKLSTKKRGLLFLGDMSMRQEEGEIEKKSKRKRTIKLLLKLLLKSKMSSGRSKGRGTRKKLL